jgi:hypothetical protein
MQRSPPSVSASEQRRPERDKFAAETSSRPSIRLPETPEVWTVQLMAWAFALVHLHHHPTHFNLLFNINFVFIFILSTALVYDFFCLRYPNTQPCEFVCSPFTITTT